MPISDEETPLLDKPSSRDRRRVTPLPKLQIAILLLLQLAEPVTSQCILPFIYQLISGLDVTADERKIGYYAGLIESLFFMMQACTTLQWGRLSDRVGRKPILLVGLFGLCISMLCFGLARTFTALVISRCLAGALNGNIGVLKSMMGELTDSTNRAQGFALIPMVWATGSTIGPSLGGLLSRPHERFPTAFHHSFWRKYPYFLSCASASAFCFLLFMVTVCFMKETVKMTNRSPTLRRLGSDETLVSPRNPTESHYSTVNQPYTPQFNAEPIPLRSLFVPPILIPIANYCSLAFLEIGFYAILPLFYSVPIKYGGLGLSTPTIGLLLGLYGLASGVFQALFNAKFIRIFGAKQVYMTGVMGYLIIYMIFPTIHLFARRWGLSPFVWILVAFQLFTVIIIEMGFGCIMMFITASAPNKHCLGAIHGLSQTTASIARAVGPSIATSLFAFSLEHNLLGGYTVYAIFFMLTWFSALLATRLPNSVVTKEEEEEENESE